MTKEGRQHAPVYRETNPVGNPRSQYCLHWALNVERSVLSVDTKIEKTKRCLTYLTLNLELATVGVGRNAVAMERRSPEAMETPDMLRELFRMQQALNERIGVKTAGMSEADKVHWLLNYCRAMSQELAELTDSVPWKWWAKYQKFDEQNARVEVVDLFHFLISLAQVLGMSPEDVYQAYLKKNAVNVQRQETGYQQKDEADSKHI